MLLSSINPISLKSLIGSSGEPSTSERLFVRAGIFEAKKGSAYVELASAKVVCVIDGPAEPEKLGGTDDDEGIIKVEVKGDSDMSTTIQSALSSVVRLDRFPKAQLSVEITIVENDAATLAAALIASSVALCKAGIETYDLCLASHFWVSENGEFHDRLMPEKKEEHSSLTVGIMPSLNQIVCCEHQGVLPPSVLLKAVHSAVKSTLASYTVVRKAIESFSIPAQEKDASKI